MEKPSVISLKMVLMIHINEYVKRETKGKIDIDDIYNGQDFHILFKYPVDITK